MPEVRTDDALLHVEVDGSGEPVTVLAHGLTNSCTELAAFTPLVSGTKVRFCFRGHGHSSVPETGYGFADFARDLDAVANAYVARNAVGTSLGAGAICHLLGEDPLGLAAAAHAHDLRSVAVGEHRGSREAFDYGVREDELEESLPAKPRRLLLVSAPLQLTTLPAKYPRWI